MSRASTGLSEHEKRGFRDNDASYLAPPDQPPPHTRPRTPLGGRRLLSFPELKAQKGIKFSRVWINNLIKRKKFPRPVTPGAGGAFSAKAWFEDEIDAWLNDLAAARDAIDDESSPADQTAGLFHFRHESQNPKPLKTQDLRAIPSLKTQDLARVS